MVASETPAAECAGLDEFVWDGEARVWVHPRHRGFAYTDGAAAEARIHKILETVPDRSLFSEELQRHIVDWPSEYHLSEARHNLLRHLPFAPGQRILELGAGCGAITRQLAESGAEVTAVEGSHMRASCAALRCADLQQARIYCADFQQIRFEPVYDWVTLIGVLEYAPTFFGCDDPLAACLAQAGSALAPGGTLVIGIENRLGLKYLLGFGEDHLGVPYVGIQDLYTDSSARTLGHAELRDLLLRCGFASVEFQYPFPDYKLPSAVLTETALCDPEFCPAEIVRQLESRDYLNRFRPAANERLVWPHIAANGLLADLSNSFLVLASKVQPPVTSHPSQAIPLAFSYSLRRRPAVKTVTEFVRRGDSIHVEKRRLLPGLYSDDGPVRHTVAPDQYAPGERLASVMMKALVQQEQEQFLRYCRMWLDFVRRTGMVAGADACVKPDYYDCIPGNLIIEAGHLRYIDREWIMTDGCSLTTLALRGLFSLVLTSDLDRTLPAGVTFEQFLSDCLGGLGMTYDPDAREQLIRAETQLNDAARGDGTGTRRYIATSLARRRIDQPSNRALPARALRYARRRLAAAYRRIAR